MSAPPGERRRGRPNGGTSSTDSTAIKYKTSIPLDQDDPDRDSPLAQMKRRRSAALRLPPLASGTRDPQFDLYPRDGAA